MTPVRETHIIQFYRDMAAMLVALYASFPRPVSLWVIDFTGETELDDFGMHSDRHLRALGCMQWLQEEGWIRFHDRERELGINQAVLTGKAFARLSGLQHQQTYSPASMLRIAVNSGDTASLIELCEQLL